MRLQVYQHLNHFLKPGSRVLELNAGTGIDALQLIRQGHRVHAIDIAEGMISEIKKKQDANQLESKLSFQHLSYDQLDQVNGDKFDYIFSNFGGLNCIDDLSRVTKHFPDLLKHGGFATLVIMPKICVWEMLTILKGNTKAFRRFRKGGVIAHVEGEYFRTWYHSLAEIKAAFGCEFSFVRSEGLAAFSPQPHSPGFPGKYPAIYRILRKLDARVRNYYPFNRWADHIIVTFRFEKTAVTKNISGH